ncbi:hypothetical protein BC829DRAFT_396386 [Chytridium lagenaria]|nr:hypothetical protein BC829DRAFT_396386 [Chytridium lagenaria]
MSTALQESIFDYVDKIDFIPSSKINYADAIALELDEARGPSLTASVSSFSSTAHRSILPHLSPSVCSKAAADTRSRRRSTDATRFDDIGTTDGRWGSLNSESEARLAILAFVSTDCMRADIMAKFECSSISLHPTSVTSVSSKAPQLPEETTPSLGRQKAEEWNSSLGRRLGRISSVLDPPELIRSLSKRGSVERRGSVRSQKSSKSHKSQSTMSSKSSRSSISTTGSSPKVKDCLFIHFIIHL